MDTVSSFTSDSGIPTEIGFDAGDEIRGVTLSEENHSLQGINTFRIDGKVFHNLFVAFYTTLCSGNCVTGLSSSDVCGVNSTSLECSGGGFTASSCICQPEALNNSKCQLTGTLNSIFVLFFVSPLQRQIYFEENFKKYTSFYYYTTVDSYQSLESTR